MRTRLASQPLRHPALAIVFVIALVASFFALAPAVQACEETHHVVIHKIATDTTSDADFTVTLSGETDNGRPFASTVVVPANGSVTIKDVPHGNYTVTELNAPQGATVSPSQLTIPGESAYEFWVTNPAGKIAIEKVVVGEAPESTYLFDITGPGGPLVASVSPGARWTSDWLPLGTYTITEQGDHDVTYDPGNTVTLAENEQLIEVTATNTYREPSGTLSITKVVTGNTAPAGPFVFDIRQRGAEVGFDVSLNAGETWTSDPLRLGTYDITERNAPAQATIVPNPAVLDTDGATVAVTATNPYPDYRNPVGRITIAKVVVGDTAPGGSFTFDLTGPVSVVATVDAGDTWTSQLLPLGRYTITERSAPSGATIVPNPVDLTVDGATIKVTATNPYRDATGLLEITKVVTGSAAPAGPFVFDIDGPVSVVATVDAGETWTSKPLPLGTYTVTERDAPPGATIVPDTVTLDTDGETATVTATNPYRDQHGKLAITKIEAGITGVGGTYTMTVTGPSSFTIDVTAGTTWTSGWLPLGTYTVTEVDAPDNVTIVPSAALLDTDGATVTVTVTNPSVASGGGATTTVDATSGALPATGGGPGNMPLIAAVSVAAGIVLMAVRGSRRHS